MLDSVDGIGLDVLLLFDLDDDYSRNCIVGYIDEETKLMITTP